MLVENFAPGALDRMGLTWEHVHKLEPAHDRRLGQGLRPGALRARPRSTENVAQCAGGAAFHHRLPRRTAAGHRLRRSATAAPGLQTRRSLSSRALDQTRPAPAAASAVLVRHAGWRARISPACGVARPAAPRGTARSPSTARSAKAWPFGRCRAARRQRLPRRSAGLGCSSARAGRAHPRRVHSFRPPRRCRGWSIRDLIGEPDLEDRSGLCHAAGAPAGA